MKQYLIVFLIFISLPLFAQQEYQSDTNSFKITFPSAWTVTKGTQPMVDVSSTPDGITSINIVVQYNPLYANLTIEQLANEEFKSSLVEQYENAFTNFVLVSSGLDSAGAYTFYNFNYSADMPTGGRLLANQYFTLRNSKLYIISTGTPAEESLNNEPLFSKTLRSFTFDE
jgi:hypothetical protein